MIIVYSKPQCVAEACVRDRVAKGMCNAHYLRAKRGQPLDPPVISVFGTPEESFGARVEPLVWSDCIVWVGAISTEGYGLISIAGGSSYAHRYAWEREFGPIPEGMVIDHSCWERSCVNPEHLRLATPSQNGWNRGKGRGGRSRFRGVSPHRRRDGVTVYRTFAGGKACGQFLSEEEAADHVKKVREDIAGSFSGKGC